VAWRQGQSPPLNFILSEIFFLSEFSKNTIIGEFKGRIEILSIHNLHCRKFTAICRKILTFLPTFRLFFNPRRRSSGGFCPFSVAPTNRQQIESKQVEFGRSCAVASGSDGGCSGVDVPQRLNHHADHHRGGAGGAGNIDAVLRGSVPPADEGPPPPPPLGSETLTLNAGRRSSLPHARHNAGVGADVGGRSTMTNRAASTCRVSPADRCVRIEPVRLFVCLFDSARLLKQVMNGLWLNVDGLGTAENYGFADSRLFSEMLRHSQPR